MNKKIIVTGGLGFIGSNLIELLIKKNYFVINIDNSTYSSNQYNVKMPICQQVCAVVQGRSDAKRGFKELLKAEIGSESEPF